MDSCELLGLLAKAFTSFIITQRTVESTESVKASICEMWRPALGSGKNESIERFLFSGASIKAGLKWIFLRKHPHKVSNWACMYDLCTYAHGCMCMCAVVQLYSRLRNACSLACNFMSVCSRLRP